MLRLAYVSNVILIALALVFPSYAQQVPAHNIPVGKGPGVVGFGYAAPGTSGQVLTSNGASADPSFQAPPNPATSASYSTVAALTAATIPSIVQTITTAGYYAAGDGGGATYVRVASAPSLPCYQQSADGAYWDLAQRSIINVKSCGAYGDGSHADDTAIGNAIAALPLVGGLNRGTVFFPVGSYACATTCINLINQRDIHFIGSSPANNPSNSGTVLELTGGTTTTPLIKLDGTESIDFSHFSFVCPSASYIGPLINLRQVSGAVVTALTKFYDFNVGCSGTKPFSATAFDVGKTLDVSLEKGWASNVGVAIQGASSTGDLSNEIFIKNVWFDTYESMPIYVGGQSWKIEDCIFEPPTNSGQARALALSPIGVNGLTIDNSGFYDAATSNGNWIDFVDNFGLGVPGVARGVNIVNGTLFDGGGLELGSASGVNITGTTFNTDTFPMITGASSLRSVNFTGNAANTHAGAPSAGPVLDGLPSSGNYIIDNLVSGTATAFH